MSLIQEQINKLKEQKKLLEKALKLCLDSPRDVVLTHFETKYLIKILKDAIFTIETQDEKLRASNLNGGWIPCSERMPEENKEVKAMTQKNSRSKKK